MTIIGTFTLKRESGSSLRLIDVVFFLGQKKNIASIAVLEDHGYDVIFKKGKFFIKHITMGKVKQIGSIVKKLYALEVEDACKALRSKVAVSDLVVEREKLSLNMQPQKQSQKVVEKLRGDRVEESTQVETSRRGKFQARGRREYMQLYLQV